MAPEEVFGGGPLIPSNFTAYTPEEVAEKFGWSPRHVRKLAREIGACRVLGNRMVLLDEDVAALLVATKPEPVAKHSKPASISGIPQVTYADLSNVGKPKHARTTSKKMNSITSRRQHYEERLTAALRQLNDAIRDVHKSGLDVDIGFLTMQTQRGPMVQVDLRTFPLDGAPPVLKVV